MTDKRMWKISLDELPNWSVWPARLLGLAPWEVPQRTIEKIDREYDKDKYRRSLALCHSLDKKALTPEDIDASHSDEIICISMGNFLYAMKSEDARLHQRSMVAEAMRAAAEKASVIVELGCGYGYNLWNLSRQVPDKIYLGGDYSQNAVQIAELLFSNKPNISIRQFNFYDLRYDLLEEIGARERAVVFTSHAIEQLPIASSVFAVLAAYQDRIQTVFHFEPCYGLYDDTLLGLLRRKYIEANDYNRDLVAVLQNRPDIRIIQIKPNVFGWNPLNPTSIIEWQFVR